MGDCYNLVSLGFKGRFNPIEGDNTPDFGSQRIHLGAVGFQTRAEGSVSTRKARLFNTNAPIGEGVTEVASVQDQSIFTCLDQVRSDLQDISPRSTFE